MPPKSTPIPYGYCHCGCGQKTKIADQTLTRLNWIRGEPIKWIVGHTGRKFTGIPEYIVNPETGCWEWQHSKNQKGYGQKHVVINGKKTSVRAHRLMYEQKFGPIPDGLELDHKCKNRACCNPDHLEPVTHTENVRRSSQSGMTMELAKAVRKRYAEMPRKYGAFPKVAKEFGISPRLVQYVCTKGWRETE